jgi:hypothetical protein
MHALLPRLRPSPAARRTVARLVLLTVLAAALVPGLSRLLQPAQAWGALCQAPATARDAASAPGDAPPAGREHGDACAFCTLAHTTPLLAGAAPAGIAVVAYAPPAPVARAALRPRVARLRAPAARGPPALRPILAA